MGVGIYPLFDPPVPTAVFDVDGKLLARNFDALDGIAAAVGLPPFSSFGDTRPIPEGFDSDPDDLADILGPSNEWFSVSEGLRMVEGLLAAITSRADGVRSLRDRAGVVAELRHLAACLRAAVACKARFRLEMG